MKTNIHPRLLLLHRRENFVFCGSVVVSSECITLGINILWWRCRSKRRGIPQSLSSIWELGRRGNKLKPKEEQRTWGNKNVLNAAGWSVVVTGGYSSSLRFTIQELADRLTGLWAGVALVSLGYSHSLFEIN